MLGMGTKYFTVSTVSSSNLYPNTIIIIIIIIIILSVFV